MRLAGRRKVIMWKKTLPLMFLTAILLVGCNSNDTVPKNNETPMENIRDDARQWENDEERDVKVENFDNDNLNQDQNTNSEIDTNRDGNNSQVEIIEDVNNNNSVH